MEQQTLEDLKNSKDDDLEKNIKVIIPVLKDVGAKHD
jgi:hypothetical protein